MIWARVLAPSASEDSLFVTADGAIDVFDAAFNTQGPNWQWSRVNGRGAAGTQNYLNPRAFTFAAGNHTIVFGGREWNTKVDRIVVTNDQAWTPDGTAPVISGVGHSNVTATTATIAWTTNEITDSQVEYGTTTAYGGTTALDASMVTSHSVTWRR